MDFIDRNGNVVPPELEGYERYVLTVDAQVPEGEPDRKPLAPARFHRAGDVVRVHKGFTPGLTWRIFDPKNPLGDGFELPPRPKKVGPRDPTAPKEEA